MITIVVITAAKNTNPPNTPRATIPPRLRLAESIPESSLLSGSSTPGLGFLRMLTVSGMKFSSGRLYTSSSGPERSPVRLDSSVTRGTITLFRSNSPFSGFMLGSTTSASSDDEVEGGLGNRSAGVFGNTGRLRFNGVFSPTVGTWLVRTAAAAAVNSPSSSSSPSDTPRLVSDSGIISPLLGSSDFQSILATTSDCRLPSLTGTSLNSDEEDVLIMDGWKSLAADSVPESVESDVTCHSLLSSPSPF